MTDYPDVEVPNAPVEPPVEPDESRIAAEFVKHHALREWTFTPHGQTGTWRRYGDGVWTEDNHSIIGDVSALCAQVGSVIRKNPHANQTALRLARSLCGYYSAN